MNENNLDDINQDSYINAAMGIGTTQDRSTQTRFEATIMYDQATLEALYIDEGFSRKVVDLPANEATRCGFEIKGDIDHEKLSKVKEKLKKLKFNKHVNRALKWRGAFGGSAIIIGIKDGGDFEKPLNENKIQDIEFLRVVDRWKLTRTNSQEDTYTDPADSRYGEVKMWTVEPTNGGSSYRVHESRMVIFDGADIPDFSRELNDGWGMSEIQKCHEQLKKMGMSYNHVNNLLERAQQAIHGIPNLSEYTKSEKGKQAVKDRADAVDYARGITNTVIKDAAETYEILQTTFAGVDSILDKYTEAVCAVSNIPVTVFMMRSPAGENATGESDITIWHKRVGQDQKNDLLDSVEIIVSLIFKSFGMDEAFEIEFNPLSTPTNKEIVENNDKESQTLERYVKMESIDRLEVRDYLRQNSKLKIDEGDIKNKPVKTEKEPVNID